MGYYALLYILTLLKYRFISNPHLRVSINTTDGVGRDTEPSGVLT
jgi:hypothetical protein